jgi:hypothetical protein
MKGERLTVRRVLPMLANFIRGRELGDSDVLNRVMTNSTITRNSDGEKLNDERRETAYL